MTSLRPFATCVHVTSLARTLSTGSHYAVSARERADAVLRSKIREPRPMGGKAKSVRQLRVAAMLQQAMSEVLDERLVKDPGIYPNGLPVSIEDVNASPCLRFATFLWSVPVVGKVQPHKFGTDVVIRKSGEAVPKIDKLNGPLEHLTPEMQALVFSVTEALNRNVFAIKALLVPKIRMKVWR